MQRFDNKKIILIAFFLIAAGCHAYLAKGAIDTFSPTYDEPVHLTAGYAYWKTGDYRFNGYHHPPFGEMWAAIPLLFMKPLLPKHHPAWIDQRWGAKDQYAFADFFLFRNRVSADAMMAAGRWMQVVMSIFLGVLIVLAAWKLVGLTGALLATGFWAFLPGFLANGAIVSTDLAFTVFYFGFFSMWLMKRTTLSACLAGIFLGLCFSSKYFALAIFPSVIAVLIWDRFTKAQAWTIKQSLIGLAFAGLTLSVVYQFTGLDVFWGGFADIFSRSQTGRSSFYAGEHGVTGWLTYFPFVFLVKTPLSLLIAMVISLAAICFKKGTFPAALWIPALAFFALACLSKVQIGHRHILVIYPFIIVMVACSLVWIGKAGAAIGGALVVWSLVNCWIVRPHYIAFFNEAAGGPSQGYKLLTDSNIDWGQGLKQLKQELPADEVEKGIYLSYFGVVDPHIYGLRYKDVGSDRIVERDDDTELNLSPTKLAVSATNLQATYYADKTIFDWLKDIKPWKVIGYSIFVYDFSNDPESIRRLEALRGNP